MYKYYIICYVLILDYFKWNFQL